MICDERGLKGRKVKRIGMNSLFGLQAYQGGRLDPWCSLIVFHRCMHANMEKYGYCLPVIPESIDILVTMSEDISAVLAGMEDPIEALESINAKVYDIMKATGYY